MLFPMRSTWSAFCNLSLRYAGVRTPHVKRIKRRDRVARPPRVRAALARAVCWQRPGLVAKQRLPNSLAQAHTDSAECRKPRATTASTTVRRRRGAPLAAQRAPTAACTRAVRARGPALTWAPQTAPRARPGAPRTGRWERERERQRAAGPLAPDTAGPDLMRAAPRSRSQRAREQHHCRPGCR
eukprot:187865-Prymnesium_polylepis.2